nr:hypothetical protein CFP56_04421 [Quercus suber]
MNESREQWRTKKRIEEKEIEVADQECQCSGIQSFSHSTTGRVLSVNSSGSTDPPASYLHDQLRLAGIEPCKPTSSWTGPDGPASAEVSNAAISLLTYTKQVLLVVP